MEASSSATLPITDSSELCMPFSSLRGARWPRCASTLSAAAAESSSSSMPRIVEKLGRESRDERGVAMGMGSDRGAAVCASFKLPSLGPSLVRASVLDPVPAVSYTHLTLPTTPYV